MLTFFRRGFWSDSACSNSVIPQTCGLSVTAIICEGTTPQMLLCAIDYQFLKRQTTASIKGYDAISLQDYFALTIRRSSLHHNKTEKVKARKCLKKNNCKTGCACDFHLIPTAPHDLLQNCFFYLLIHVMEILAFMTYSARGLHVAIASLSDIIIVAFAYAIENRK